MTIAPIAPVDGFASGAESEDLRRHVGPAMFRELLVSHRRLIRADEPQWGLRGLRDLDSGEHFVVEERRLNENRR